MLRDEYIFQEILEQESIAVLHQRLEPIQYPSGSGSIILTGSGDSHCAALFGHWLLQEQNRVFGLPALEASSAALHLSPKDVLLGISVSGRTIRVVEAAQRALNAGARVVAVTDNPESPLAQLASQVWLIHASPALELSKTDYRDGQARQYVGYHHDVAQTKTFWAVLLTLIRAAQVDMDWEELLTHIRLLIAPSFYNPLITKGSHWGESGQTFFVGSGWTKIAARFATYKMYEFNRLAHFTGIEEFCHTHYFITRTGDTIVFLIDDLDAAARAVEIVPVLNELFSARIIWLQTESLGKKALPANLRLYTEVVNLPDSSRPIQKFLNLILALQWLTYAIGRVNAPNINTFHAGYDTERLVAGTLRTIRKSKIRAPEF
jgi:D-arabinose 5-phosphate isomerase GutQ